MFILINERRSQLWPEKPLSAVGAVMPRLIAGPRTETKLVKMSDYKCNICITLLRAREQGKRKEWNGCKSFRKGRSERLPRGTLTSKHGN